MIQKAKSYAERLNKKLAALSMMVAAFMLAALPAGAAPAAGNTDIDSILTEMETGFGTAKAGFVYLAIAAIPITLLVVAFFWLRGKFKQAVSGS